MKDQLITRGKNITFLQGSLLKKMDGSDATRVITKAEDLVRKLPETQGSKHSLQGLMLGLVQSGKTVALTTAIALAADNGYSCFIVLTSDNLWLYDQTIDRLKADLPGLQVEGKDDWERQEMFMTIGLTSTDSGVVLVATKNTTVLSKLSDILDRLNQRLDGGLPTALIIDDEADQASLDTQASRRAKNPNIEQGRTNTLITRIRNKFSRYTYLQVTATPQALFLQETDHPYRPEFSILIEPGKGYIGGNTFFSLIEGETDNLIRYIEQRDLDSILGRNPVYSVDDNKLPPKSLRDAMSVFFVGSTVKILQGRLVDPLNDLKFSFLCHISERKKDHEKAFDAIAFHYKYLVDSLLGSPTIDEQLVPIQELRAAYNEILITINSSIALPSFEEVVAELQKFIIGTDIQILNSDKDQDQPRYSRRYNILIGGTKLSRGVTIEGLIVTYYGRQAKHPNMDTMLQHARMYGYRQRDLDVTRLFVTKDVESRFRVINDSEQSLREVIEKYPGKEYRGIRIGQRLNATRRNVLNPNNVGAYAAGKSYFPSKPLFRREDISNTTRELDEVLKKLHPQEVGIAVEIDIDQMIRILELIKSDPSGSGLWDDRRIITGLEQLKKDPVYKNRAFLVVRRNRNLNPNKDMELGAVLTGGSVGEQGLVRFAVPEYPTLFMLRINGNAAKDSNDRGWDGVPFWVPNVRFPDGQYALMFNFE